MVEDMIKDVKVFSAMLFICLMTFANVIIVLNYNRANNEDEPIFDDLVGSPPFNALIHSWLTGLGDFNKDFYTTESGTNKVIIWIIFFLATVLVQLIYLNLLIAIMSESFARLNEMQGPSTLKSFCNIMLDHLFLVDVDRDFKDVRYILWLSSDELDNVRTSEEKAILEAKTSLETRITKQDLRFSKVIK